MKTHILFAIATALLVTACASHEGRKVSGTQESSDEQTQHSSYEGNAGREVFRR